MDSDTSSGSDTGIIYTCKKCPGQEFGEDERDAHRRMHENENEKKRRRRRRFVNSKFNYHLFKKNRHKNLRGYLEEFFLHI